MNARERPSVPSNRRSVQAALVVESALGEPREGCVPGGHVERHADFRALGALADSASHRRGRREPSRAHPPGSICRRPFRRSCTLRPPPNSTSISSMTA